MSDERFVLIKRGLFWRPDGCGYTSDLLHAGVYDKAEADRHNAWALEFPYEATTSKPLSVAVREYVGRGLTREVLEEVLLLLRFVPTAATEPEGAPAPSRVETLPECASPDCKRQVWLDESFPFCSWCVSRRANRQPEAGEKE